QGRLPAFARSAGEPPTGTQVRLREPQPVRSPLRECDRRVQPHPRVHAQRPTLPTLPPIVPREPAAGVLLSPPAGSRDPSPPRAADPYATPVGQPSLRATGGGTENHDAPVFTCQGVQEDSSCGQAVT